MPIKNEMGERGREVRDWLIERFTESEMSERGRKRGNGVIESHSYNQVSEARGKIVS